MICECDLCGAVIDEEDAMHIELGLVLCLDCYRAMEDDL